MIGILPIKSYHRFVMRGEAMLNIGDKVKFNIEKLEEINWSNLKPEENTSNKDYEPYIRENAGEVFEILKIDEFYAPYVVNDEFLKDTSFEEDELIKVD